MRAGAAGLRQTRASFRPAADAVLPRCRPHFLGGEGSALPSHHARLRDISGRGGGCAGGRGRAAADASLLGPADDAVLPRCRPHFLVGRAAPSPHHARLRESGADLVPGEEMHPAYVSGLAASPDQAPDRRRAGSAARRSTRSSGATSPTRSSSAIVVVRPSFTARIATRGKLGAYLALKLMLPGNPRGAARPGVGSGPLLQPPHEIRVGRFGQRCPRMVAADPTAESRCCVNERLSVTAGWRAESTDYLSHNTVAIDASKATDFCNRTGRLGSSSAGGSTSKASVFVKCSKIWPKIDRPCTWADSASDSR